MGELNGVIMETIGYSTYKLLILVRDNPEMQLTNTKYAKPFFELLKKGYTNRTYVAKDGKNNYEYNTVTEKGLDAIREFERQRNNDMIAEKALHEAKKANVISILAFIIPSIISIVSIIIAVSSK